MYYYLVRWDSTDAIPERIRADHPHLCDRLQGAQVAWASECTLARINDDRVAVIDSAWFDFPYQHPVIYARRMGLRP